jgi:alkylation response protein AidB-like acyl-CoA dehydrogenase
VHGGYGFSEEYDMQLFYRRARGWALALGDPAEVRLSLADRFWPREANR